MNANKVIPENLVAVRYFEKITSVSEDRYQSQIERLEGCDWSRSSFIEAIFSNVNV